MPQTLLGVDICNTLADINTELKKVFGANPDPSQYFIPGVTTEFVRKNLWIFKKAAPLYGAAHTLNLLIHSGKYEIVYITARPIEAKEVTLEWLKRNGFPQREVIFTTRKPEVAKALNVAAAIDDAPHEIDGYLEAGIPVFVKRQPYNLNYQNAFDWAFEGIRCFSQ